MKKKQIVRIFLLLIAILVAFAWYMSYKKYQEKEQLREAYQLRPELTFYSIEKDSLQQAFLYDDMYTVIVFFNSNCEFCKLELNSFKKHKDEIKDIQFAFISAEHPDTLRALKANLDFSEIFGVDIYKSEAEEINAKFGKIGVPSMYVYAKNDSLIEEFRGFTRIDDLLLTIKENHADQAEL